ncbi:hypothetical protein ECG_00962 [Echinococcus granulosus]|uniref:Transporter n=1 Tax=Echinococcus granulosus TaxID=6210 RepID=A0A068W938_ECHGR|nr:hypothetical protein ECG_00962 [Echinococcus granulosus]CDS16148.1 hypothetical protein EgrG_002018100 [Echinococcus granulosus]
MLLLIGGFCSPYPVKPYLVHPLAVQQGYSMGISELYPFGVRRGNGGSSSGASENGGETIAVVPSINATFLAYIIAARGAE